MNYLAHAYFSNDDEGLLIGNFIADHLRGNNFDHLSEEVKAGIKLHRQIDTFTDSHPSFKKSKRLFYDGFERYAGVLVDLYFDHLLARDFELHHTVTLPDFAQQVYTVYQKNSQLLPMHSNRFLGYVLENNIYVAYGKEQGIEKVLFHLSHRIKHGVMLNESISLFKLNELELKEHFQTFITDAKNEFLK
ncbi:MAG: ACP phosphodiesterase [Sphingobacteriaceae bacterium]|jgi:acyl carrier protein phosphodiesterase